MRRVILTACPTCPRRALWTASAQLPIRRLAPRAANTIRLGQTQVTGIHQFKHERECGICVSNKKTRNQIPATSSPRRPMTAMLMHPTVDEVDMYVYDGASLFSLDKEESQIFSGSTRCDHPWVRHLAASLTHACDVNCLRSFGVIAFAQLINSAHRRTCFSVAPPGGRFSRTGDCASSCPEWHSPKGADLWKFSATAAENAEMSSQLCPHRAGPRALSVARERACNPTRYVCLQATARGCAAIIRLRWRRWR